MIGVFNSALYSDCSDLDYSDCIQYPDYCEWNQDGNVCQDIGSGGDNDSFIEPSCIPFDQTDPIPYNTTEYANMCLDYVGVPPTIDCGDGVAIPIYVNGD